MVVIPTFSYQVPWRAIRWPIIDVRGRLSRVIAGPLKMGLFPSPPLLRAKDSSTRCERASASVRACFKNSAMLLSVAGLPFAGRVRQHSSHCKIHSYTAKFIATLQNAHTEATAKFNTQPVQNSYIPATAKFNTTAAASAKHNYG